MATKFKPLVMDLGGRMAIKAEGCALTVRFGSVGAGIDITAKQRIKQLLEEDAAVIEVESYAVGREGETMLCIRLDPERDGERLFSELEAVATTAFFVSISTHGREFRSPGRIRP